MYVAHSDYIDTSLSPVDWYKEMVVLGAEYHKLPQGYIESIRSVPSSVEARPAEVAQELKTLEQMRLINKSLT